MSPEDARPGAAQHPPLLSIIIINYNTHDLVRACLQSILLEVASMPQSHGNRLEVLVVDNCSKSAGIRDVIGELTSAFLSVQAHLELVESPENLGFTGGNNLALRRARGRVLLLLNNDTLVHPGCLKACLRYLEQQPGVGILGPRLLNADGSHQASCRSFPGFATALFNRHSLLTRWFPGNPWSRRYLRPDASLATEPMDVDWVSGAAMFITRRALAQVGLLDDAFFMYAEDVDYCLRAHEAGWKVQYFPQASITHLIGQSSATVPFRTTWWRHRSMWLYYRKHHSRRIALFDAVTLLGIGARCALNLGQSWVVRR